MRYILEYIKYSTVLNMQPVAYVTAEYQFLPSASPFNNLNTYSSHQHTSQEVKANLLDFFHLPVCLALPRISFVWYYLSTYTCVLGRAHAFLIFNI